MKMLHRTLIIIALLGLAAPAVAADAGAQPETKVAAPATKAPAATPPAAEPTPEPKAEPEKKAEEPAKKEEPKAEEGLSMWQGALKHGMELVFMLLGLMAMALVRVLMKKYGFEEQSGKVNDVLMKAIGFAEQWAIKKSKLEGAAAPGGAKKMEMAVDFAKKLATEYKLPEKGSDWWEHKLEGWLGIEKAKANAAVNGIKMTATSTENQG